MKFALILFGLHLVLKYTAWRYPAFRERLIEAYEGRCAITGCAVTATLEAAHLRHWREGSGVGDGILLRIDLHRLFDAGLLTIDPDYKIRVSPEAAPDYAQYDGVKLRLPRRVQDWPRAR